MIWWWSRWWQKQRTSPVLLLQELDTKNCNITSPFWQAISSAQYEDAQSSCFMWTCFCIHGSQWVHESSLLRFTKKACKSKRSVWINFNNLHRVFPISRRNKHSRFNKLTCLPCYTTEWSLYRLRDLTI